jgi:cyclopropane-fatty-acyl-phospholipid synthase
LLLSAARARPRLSASSPKQALPSPTTEPLRKELARALPERPFALSFWDGSSLPATQQGAPTFEINSPQAFSHLLRAPGELGLGRAYALGLIDTDDIDGAMLLVDGYEPPRPGPLQIVRLALAVLRGAGFKLNTQLPETELRLTGKRHTIARDRRAVRHHYDSGNDFFKLFLDETMTYSCAYWKGGATTLAEAQDAKREIVCTKLGLRAGERLLDVGCGWGAMAMHAASRHGARAVGISLSQPQVDLANERAAAAGLADEVEFRVADYREMGGEQFDAISSIGMVEHVGEERIDLYAQTLFGLLKPGGRLLNHGIAKLADFDTKDEGPFSERFVFPDGVPIPLSRIVLALERAGFNTTHVEGLQADYARTLDHWIASYEARYDEAVAIAGEERARVYKLYLRAARQGFTTGWASIYQVLATRP